ncbi:unnamed protein product, partial [Prorocentrum cordatum]
AWRTSSWCSSSWWKGVNKDPSDPPERMGWTGFRIWRRQVRRRLDRADIRATKRSDRLLLPLDPEVRRQFQDIPNTALTSEAGPSLIPSRLDTPSAQRHDDDRRTAGCSIEIGPDAKSFPAYATDDDNCEASSIDATEEQEILATLDQAQVDELEVGDALA